MGKKRKPPSRAPAPLPDSAAITLVLNRETGVVVLSYEREFVRPWEAEHMVRAIAATFDDDEEEEDVTEGDFPFRFPM